MMEQELILTELQPFNLVILAVFLRYRVLSTTVAVFEGFFSYFVNMMEHNEDMHYGFWIYM